MARLIDDGVVETLEKRRKDYALKFALQASMSTRFGERWFTRNTSDRDVRKGTRNNYIEKFARTERGKNNPLNYLTRLLNEHLKH